MSRILADKENEIASIVKSENDVLQKLKLKLQNLEEENRLLQVIIKQMKYLFIHLFTLTFPDLKFSLI